MGQNHAIARAFLERSADLLEASKRERGSFNIFDADQTSDAARLLEFPDLASRLVVGQAHVGRYLVERSLEHLPRR
jgi:hypothetical protein